MVFIALPALQRSQRNTRRRSDLSRIESSVEDYRANNNGTPPIKDKSSGSSISVELDSDFVKRYIDSSCKATVNAGPIYLGTEDCGEQFRDPDGSPYNLYGQKITRAEQVIPDGDFQSGDTKFIIFAWQSKCADDTEGKVIKTGNANEYALLMKLEGGAVACQDNK